MPSMMRDSDSAFVFHAVVDDLKLGGTGAVWLGVWTNWLGTVSDEPEIVWDQMPRGGDMPQPTESRWTDAQLFLLKRIAQGEKAFYPPRSSEQRGSEYDESVEHLMALRNRGLITCKEPGPGRHGATQYDAVIDIALTAEGQGVLDGLADI